MHGLAAAVRRALAVVRVPVPGMSGVAARGLGLLSLAAPAALAAEQATTAAQEFDAASRIPVMAGALLAVVFVILLLAAGLRLLSGTMLRGNGPLRIVAGLSLGARERLLIVEAGDRQLLLGITPGRISMLHQFEPRIGEPELAGGAEGSQPGFARRLAEALGGRTA